VERPGEGVDTLDFSGVGRDLTIQVDGAGTVTVAEGANRVTAYNVEKIIAGTGADDTLSFAGVTASLVFTVQATGDVSVDGADTLTFSAVEHLTGGDEGDTFVFEQGASLDGSLDGGEGPNTLSYTVDVAEPEA
jgi:hypothetical protein